MKYAIIIFLLLIVHLNLKAQVTISINVEDISEDKVKIDTEGDFLQENQVIDVKNKDGNKVIINNKSSSNVKVSFRTSNITAGGSGTQELTVNKGDDTTLNFDKDGSTSTNKNLFSGTVTVSISEINNTSPFFRRRFSFRKSETTDDPKEADDATEIKVTGIPIYDAQSIFFNNQDINPAQRDRIIGVLSYYKGKEASSWAELKELYKNNLFIKQYLDNLNVPESLIEEHSTGVADNPFKGLSLSSIGGLDVTNIADGLAKFLVKRTKEELNVAFFQKFKEVIADSNYVDLQTVFPKTYNLISAIGEDVYNYNKYLQNLREAFKDDLDDLNRNLPTVVDNHPQFFKKHPELEASLRSGCYVAGELENQVHPGDILTNYPIEYLEKIDNKNYKGAIQTLQLVSTSLRDSSTVEDSLYWVGIKQVRELVNNKLALQIYLGLLYQEAINKYDGIHYQNTTLVKILDKAAPDYNKDYDVYKRYILRFGERADALNRMIKNYNKPATDSLAFEQYAKYFRASVEMIEYSTTVTQLPYVNEIKDITNLPNKLRKYFDIAYSASDMVIEINRKNYSSAINHAVHMYDVINVRQARQDVPQSISTTARDKARMLKKYNKAIARVERITGQELNSAARDSLAGIIFPKEVKADIDLLAQVDSLKKWQATLSKFARYGSFMASVATAKNSDQVESAIETFALPSGSSRIKRASSFNVSLNAYVGIFAGYEQIEDVDKPYRFQLDKQWNSYGITAPVGVAASWGKRQFLPWKGNGHWSYSLFVSVIDIGSITAYRFKDPGKQPKDTTVTTQNLPTIQLKDILSPGAFISIGIPKSPISINLGAQLGSNLRKVNVSTTIPDGTGGTKIISSNEYADKAYWRFSISILVDIPILNFYTKSAN